MANTDEYDRVLLESGWPWCLASKFLPEETKRRVDEDMRLADVLSGVSETHRTTEEDTK